jgi:hypothetical protein
MPLFYSPGVVRVGTSVQLETVTDSFVVGAAATGGTFTPLSNELRISGNGASGVVTFYTNSAERWRINASGHLLPGGDFTFDIGASANEVRALYINGQAGNGSAILFNNAATSLVENTGFLICSGGWSANNAALGYRTAGGEFLLTASGGNNLFIDTGAAGSISLRPDGANIKFKVNTTGVGFNNATPIARPTYTVTNPTTDRALNVTADTLAQGLAVLGTLIADLQSYGLLQ